MEYDCNKAFTEAFYKVDKITNTYKDVQWGSDESQKIRFHYLNKLFKSDNKERASLLDVGCGIAHYYDFLLDGKFTNIQYTGLDIQKSFIEYASEKHRNSIFINKSLFELETDKKYDYVVASGTFNVTLPNVNMYQYIKQCIDKMYDLCNKGIAFNLLSSNTPKEYMGDKETYFNPIEILKLCFEHTNKIDLYHSYKINDFTIIIFK
ncbi:class I SAM-dependent methyltransferase [Bacillus sp. FJAT-49736]|uniref:class I SAM-dependent methyltransferase n=1 Tax=Bacillus sp. FJAT-49736 TaxID=2833582 RepID=UPI001BC96E9F|nr:class I SAM-dependent methyltransferase [Bacillus sp. FJAT-49736]MBS4173021.1 class I SAM-dependent methyltransferase [Bacillus sp. FJAT-49736]